MRAMINAADVRRISTKVHFQPVSRPESLDVTVALGLTTS